jgi:hypothetical protein
MATRRPKPGKRLRALLIGFMVAVICLVAGAWGGMALSAERLFSGLLWPLLRLIFFITMGLALGQLIEAAGWVRHLGKLAGPLFQFACLGQRCSASFATAIVSGTAANAMLMALYEERQIERRQLIFSNLINHVPSYFLHLPTTLFIVLPLTGRAGGWYFALTFAALILRTAGIVLVARRGCGTFSAGQRSQPAAVPDASPPATAGLWLAVKQKLPGRLLGIAVYVIPIYTAVFVLNNLGLFRFTREWLANFVVSGFIPMEALSVVILSFVAEFSSGFAAAGALQAAGVLTIKQTVLALLIGNILAFPMRALRHQLPRYVGIFAPKLGTQLLLLGQGLRVLSLTVVGILFFMLF